MIDMQPDPMLKLKPREIEKVFNLVVYDLHRMVIYDGIDMLEMGFQIRSHDLHGPLPVIEIEDTLDRYPVLERLQQRTAQLCAIAKMRAKLNSMLPQCQFLLPTRTDKGHVVGLMFKGRTVLAENRTHWEAYQRLIEKAVRSPL